MDWVELWDEPRNLASYDWRLDPTWETFSALIEEGARCAHAAGKRVVLGGMSPVDPLWLDRLLERLDVEVADLRDAASVRRAVSHAGEVFHFGAQVAVTTSLDGPTHDFEVNARGTFNVLEALRAMDTLAPLVFTSTNKDGLQVRDLLFVEDLMRAFRLAALETCAG